MIHLRFRDYHWSRQHMRQSKQENILLELMRQLDERENVDAGVVLRNPVEVYTSRDLAGKEWTKFFEEYPQVIGLSGDLPEKGSFLTVDEFGIPILATRDSNGHFRAFLNACRHRGVKVEGEERGQRSKFSCPFHKWTYNGSGELVGIPQEHQFGTVDKSCRGLIELGSVEMHGLLWVHPKPGSSLDVPELLGDFGPELEGWELTNMRWVGQTAINMNLNWKLANDTFGETYHFHKLHKDTVGRIFYGDALDYEVFRRNHRFVFPSRGIDRVRTKPKSEWRLTHGAVVLYYLFPNIQLVVGRGTINLIRIYPIKNDPGKSSTKVSHYFSDDLIAAQSVLGDSRVKITPENIYDVEKRSGALPSLVSQNEVFVSTISEQDYIMGESTQKAAENGLLDHLLFGRNEPALHHFHNTFREALGMKLLEIHTE